MTAIVHHADARDVLASLDDNSVDGCVTDPPYALTSIVERFGGEGAARAQSGGASGVYARASAGFMGQAWDTGETAFDASFWRELYRVLKPGAWVAACGGTRTYHRLAVAIEDGGFDIRDMTAWLYGSGFPKSLDFARDGDLSEALGRRVCQDRFVGTPWEEGGHGTAQKPALEPICLARKPFAGSVADNVLAWGVGGLNIDGCRVATEEDTRRLVNTAIKGGRFAAGGSASDGTLGGGHDLGRWPANVAHDGSAVVLEAFPAAAGQKASIRGDEPSRRAGRVYNPMSSARVSRSPRMDEAGTAARFFYTAKASPADRVVQCLPCGQRFVGRAKCPCNRGDAQLRGHPTVKPISLVAWLCRLIGPAAGGLIIDPFAGSGTLAAACAQEGFDCLLVEREAEFVGDILHRVSELERGA